MNLRMIGCSYHDADLSVRQKLAFDDAQMAIALTQWQRELPGTELAILSTCNRVELYAAGAVEAPQIDQLIAALASFHGLPVSGLANKLVKKGDEYICAETWAGIAAV